MIRSLVGALGGALVLIIGACASLPAAADETGPIARPAAGPVQGATEDGLAVFKGVPYARPPLGPRRWRAPEPLPAWSEVRSAQDFGPACIQPTPRSVSIYSQDLGAASEDCLTLNVWSPDVHGRAPVLVWIHGGSLVAGSSKERLYDGARLASEGVVVVSINYRLGVLGYLAHPELSAESDRHVSGNYGLLDQIAALEWIKSNIAAFGGDPDQITVAGESAGGLSVMYLMTSPLARGLFDRAIVQSGYMISLPALREAGHGAPAAEASGAALSAMLGATGLADLRALDAQALTDGAAGSGFFATGVVDGWALPDQTTAVFDAGAQAPVPLLVGFNSGEIRSLRMLAPAAPASAAEYEATIRARYGDLGDAFLSLYPADDGAESVLATTRDALYGWTSERMAQAQTRLGQPAYLYLFDHGYPAADTAGLHAFHASELPYMFGNPDRTPPRWPAVPATDAERALSEQMVGYWSSFAKQGRPEAAAAPIWPAYGREGAYMRFGDRPEAATDLMPGMVELHERTVCRRAAADLAWNWNTGLWSPVLPGPTPGCD